MMKLFGLESSSQRPTDSFLPCIVREKTSIRVDASPSHHTRSAVSGAKMQPSSLNPKGWFLWILD